MVYFQENYNFGYAVKDDLSGDDFSHQVTNDGRKTKGEYRVALPDGRVQVLFIKKVPYLTITIADCDLFC